MNQQTIIQEAMQMAYKWGQDLFDQIDKDMVQNIGFPERPEARMAFLQAVKQAQSPEELDALLQQRAQQVGEPQVVKELQGLGRAE